MIGRGLQYLLGGDVAGVGSFAALATSEPRGRAAMVWSMLVLRRITADDAFDRLRAVVDEHRAQYPAILALRDALPQHADLLRPGAEDRLAALPESEAARVRGDVTRYLSQHPDVATTLGLETL